MTIRARAKNDSAPHVTLLNFKKSSSNAPQTVHTINHIAMPKEQIRKRGKRKNKREDESQVHPTPNAEQGPPAIESVREVVDDEKQSAGPSGIHPARAAFLAGKTLPPSADTDPGISYYEPPPAIDHDHPFGELDPDIKAYFRTVEDQIRDWQSAPASHGEDREDRRTFLASVLSELRGHELQVATDPDTSVVLERLLPSLSDWGRRVIGDAFAGEMATLLQHRFGSHVIQTWFNLAAGTLDREVRN
jgi:nucleolar protein 9